jgi:hypothetical protein
MGSTVHNSADACSRSSVCTDSRGPGTVRASFVCGCDRNAVNNCWAKAAFPAVVGA